jgi:hypothetical protein
MAAWLEEYTRILSGNVMRPADLAWAQQLKDQHIPGRIYKYRGVNNWSLANLERDCVWIASPGAYNDPYECAISLDAMRLRAGVVKSGFQELMERAKLKESFSAEELDELEASADPSTALAQALFAKGGSQLSPHQQQQFLEVMESTFRRFGDDTIRSFVRMLQGALKVCAFSTRKDSVVMWSHYADSHRGFCIEYSTDHLPGAHELRLALQPVVYSDDLFDITRHLLSTEDQDFNRIFGIVAAYTMPKASAVFLGTRMEDADRAEVMRIATDRQIPCFAMQMTPGAFRLEPAAVPHATQQPSSGPASNLVSSPKSA